MFVVVYFQSSLEVGRDELEDIIVYALRNEQGKFLAKTRGGGSGIHGSNIDLEVDNSLGVDEVVRRIRQALQAHEDVPHDTYIAIEGQRFPLYPS